MKRAGGFRYLGFTKYVKILKSVLLNTIENALFVGKVLHNLNKVDSTNAYALKLLSNSRPAEGTVINTNNQTSGRGQGRNKWISESNSNITLSIVFYPHFLAPKQQFFLNMALSLGVRDLVSIYTDESVKVKWSNDIYVGDRKIGGILIQNHLSNAQITSSVFGLGLNINQVEFPSDLPNPTSLAHLSGKLLDLEKVKLDLFRSVEKRYLQLKAGDLKKLKADYQSNLYRFMEDHLYQRMDNEEIISGRIIGIDPSGKLILNHLNGEEAFSIQEIKFLKSN